MGNWQEVVAEQVPFLHKLVDSGYICGVSFCGVNEAEAAPYLGGLPFYVISEGGQLSDYESKAIAHCQELAYANPNALIGYIHTKGVSAPDNQNKIGWRHAMQIALFDDIACTERTLLNNKADAIGLDWQPFTGLGIGRTSIAHFSGNFWLAKGSYLARLMPFWDYYARPRTADQRTACEFWIGSWDGQRRDAPRPKIVSLWLWQQDLQDKKNTPWQQVIADGVQLQRTKVF